MKHQCCSWRVKSYSLKKFCLKALGRLQQLKMKENNRKRKPLSWEMRSHKAMVLSLGECGDSGPWSRDRRPCILQQTFVFNFFYYFSSTTYVDPKKNDWLDVNHEKEFIFWGRLLMVTGGPNFMNNNSLAAICWQGLLTHSVYLEEPQAELWASCTACLCELWRAGPIKWHWSNQDRTKYIKQSGVTHGNQDTAMTLWFKSKTT